jgi:hypothetical protein
MEPSARAYNGATLYMRDIMPGHGRPCRVLDSEILKYGHRVPRVSDPRMTSLARTNSNFKLHTLPHVREVVT